MPCRLRVYLPLKPLNVFASSTVDSKSGPRPGLLRGLLSCAALLLALGATLLQPAVAQTSARVWYITLSSTTSQTGVYTVNVNGSAAATDPVDIGSTPSVSYASLDGLAIDPTAGVYFVANFSPTGPEGDTNQILEGRVSGGAPSVIYTSGNSGGDAIVGLAFDTQNGLIYFAVTDANVGSSDTDTGIYTISALGTGTRTATKLVDLSGGTQAPNDIAIDTTNNLLFYTNGVPGLSAVEEVGVANLTTGAVINSSLVSYSAGGNVEPFGIAVDPATDTLYWTTLNFSANSGNAIYSATYSTGGSVSLSDTQTLATTSQSQVPYGISLDIPAGGYYVDTATGTAGDTTPNEILFGSSLNSPETLTSVYSVPDQDGGTETLPTEAIVVEAQPVVDASGTVNFVPGDGAAAIDSGATVSDASGYFLAGATVSISTGFSTGDALSFTNQNGITGSFNAGTGTLMLTGTANAADYQEALDSVSFSTTSSSTTARTLSWTVTDGVVSSATATSTVDVLLPQTITFPVLPPQLVGTTYTLPATASSGLPITYTSMETGLCTISGSTANLLAIGYCTVYASQSGNDVYAPATRVARNIDIAGQSQTITFPQIPPQRAKNVITLPATVSSGLGIIYASTTPTICMTNYDNGGTALMLAPGFCGIWAWQPGNSVYAEAPMVGRTFHVMQALQTMTFPAISPQPAASTYTLPATASSRLPITYASTTPSICTINGEKANLLAPGYCGIYASQAGNIIYKPAPAVGRTFQVVKASQTITFPAISPQPAASTYSLPATTNSGLPITYTSITPSICTISGEVANLLALGYCGIYASQPGNSIYKPAETVGRTFQVVKASQSITFAAIPAQQVNTTYTLTATASSGLPITYTSSTPSICTITGGSANLIATGYCGIYASQPGNSVYSAATTVGRNLQVVP